MIILFLLLILLLLVFYVKTELFQDEYISDYITIYEEKLKRFKKLPIINILIIGSISQKKFDFITNYFDNGLYYIYNEDYIQYKNTSDNIIQNENNPFTSEEILSLKDSKNNFDIIITEGQVSLDNFIFIAQNYINLLNKEGIILFQNVQTIENSGKIIDKIPLNIKNKFEIIDLRRVNGKYDNICLIMNKK
jgi:hypothetical protein